MNQIVASDYTPDTAAWVDSIRRKYELSDSAAVLLMEAAHIRDIITRADAQVARDGYMIPGQGNTSRAHPMLRIAQDSRSLLLRHLLALGLESEVGEPRPAGSGS